MPEGNDITKYCANSVYGIKRKSEYPKILGNIRSDLSMEVKHIS